MSNLYSVSENKNRLAVKKGAAGGKKPAVKKGKPTKDPNKPKRPASAFFVFMYGAYFCCNPFCSIIYFVLRVNFVSFFIRREDFRKTYKEKHPNNKSVSAVSSCTSFRSRFFFNYFMPFLEVRLNYFLVFYRLERQAVRNGNPCLRL